MTIEELIRTSIDDHVASPPPVDVEGLVRRGRRRRAALAGSAALVVAACGVGTVVAWSAPSDGGGVDSPTHAIGQLDYDNGLRAYKSPDDDVVHLGGSTFEVSDLVDFDTGATATPYGLVYFSADQQPHLLTEDGATTDLADPIGDPGDEFSVTSGYDASGPIVAWTQFGGGDFFTVVAYDADAGAVVAARAVPCGAGCDASTRPPSVKVDRGVVFVETAEGTFAWDPATGSDGDLTPVLGPDASLADVRNGTILYDGRAPDAPTVRLPGSGSWALTPGAVDAQLSHDGRYVLDWSKTLKPVDPDDPALTLELNTHGSYIFVTFDTDGSVLAIVPGRGNRSSVYDCVLPSGTCASLGELVTRSGDPMFVGNDG